MSSSRAVSESPTIAALLRKNGLNIVHLDEAFANACNIDDLEPALQTNFKNLMDGS